MASVLRVSIGAAGYTVRVGMRDSVPIEFGEWPVPGTPRRSRPLTQALAPVMLALRPLRELTDGGPMNVVDVKVEAPLGTLPRRVLMVVVLVCAAVLERIEVALSMAHDPGASSGTFADIATPARLTTEKVATEIAQAWGQYTGVGAAEGLICVYGVVDVLLMFSLAILLVVMGRVLAGEAVSSFGGWLVRNAAVVGYLVFDLVETLAVVLLWRAPLTELHAMLIAGASLFKWLFLVVAVGALLVRFVQSGGQVHLARALLALRGQLVVVVVLLGLLLALSGPLGRQIDEVMVIAAEGGTAAALALVFGVGASAVLAWGGARCAVAYQHPASRPDHVTQRRWGRIGLVLLVIAVVTAVSGITPDRWDATRHATALAIGLVGALLAPSCIAWVRGENVETVGNADDGVDPAAAVGGSLGTPPPRWLVRVVADIPLLALLIAIVRAATTAWTAGQPLVVQDLVVFGVGTAVVWLALHLLLGATFFSGMDTEVNNRSEQPQQQEVAGGSPLRVHLIEAALPVVLLGIMAFLPLSFFAFLGTPAIVMLFALLAALLTTALTLVGDDVRWGGVLDAVGVLRVPVFTLVLVWGIAASVVDIRGGYYDVRTEVSAPARESILGAFERWKSSQHIDKPQQSRTVVPLVFVAAHGGGIRAAYWTRIGMECTFGTLCDEGGPRTVFLASGVSGGALGLASFRSLSSCLCKRSWLVVVGGGRDRDHR